jgi:hypothetical protein
MLLHKYGTHLTYQVQHINGKPCDSCDATGLYRKYDYRHNHYYKEWCWSCQGTGLYKMTQWNLLSVYKLGLHTFHLPNGRHYGLTNPHPIGFTIIEGYIDHDYSQIGKYCTWMLYLFYDRTEFKIQLKQEIHRLSVKVNDKLRRIKKYSWQDAILYSPKWPNVYFIKADGSLEEQLPF